MQADPAEAGRFDTSNSVQSLRAALGRALVIASQKQARREVLWSQPGTRWPVRMRVRANRDRQQDRQAPRYVSNAHRHRMTANPPGSAGTHATPVA